MAGKKLRLILGDQLNERHHWYQTVESETLYVIAELKQETDYVKHHVQKVCAFFDAMARFANKLANDGHQVKYLTLDETQTFRDLPELLRSLIDEGGYTVFEYQQPDEYRLNEQLTQFCTALPIASQCVESEHFFLNQSELPDYFQAQKHNRMESFYRKMRKRFGVLMEGDGPVGGKWNFDASNRKSFKRSDLASIPEPLQFTNDVSEILIRIKRHGISTFGKEQDLLIWPTDQVQARALLAFFCEYCLPRFGLFQDAMTSQSPHSWSLYHSRLSFALNAKILSPHEVIDAAMEAYYQRPSEIDVAQIEGFVRQIIGWREYVRGMYWVNMPSYAEQNALGADRDLPQWFWNGETKMACVQHSIRQSLDYAYAHHIQRLMITGNFSLLSGLDPRQVDAWYLGIYIDAVEWVELPNTRGMALFADGGWIATKPYAASGNYVNKMSDYCKSCHYQVKEKISENSCPLNSLYWDFIGRHEGRFSGNQRLSFVMKQWANKTAEDKEKIRDRAKDIMANLDSI